MIKLSSSMWIGLVVAICIIAIIVLPIYTALNENESKHGSQNIHHLLYGYDDRTNICFAEDKIGTPFIIPCTPQILKLAE